MGNPKLEAVRKRIIDFARSELDCTISDDGRYHNDHKISIDLPSKDVNEILIVAIEQPMMQFDTNRDDVEYLTMSHHHYKYPEEFDAFKAAALKEVQATKARNDEVAQEYAVRKDLCDTLVHQGWEQEEQWPGEEEDERFRSYRFFKDEMIIDVETYGINFRRADGGKDDVDRHKLYEFVKSLFTRR